MAIQRVASRVAQGGHDIAIPDIRRRYARGLRNLNQIYLPIVDEAWVLNGSVTPPEMIWRRSDGEEWAGNRELWKLIQSFEGGNL
jgi:predicted ABC-type ATPase